VRRAAKATGPTLGTGTEGRSDRPAGFTLVEVLVVVAIMGIVVALAAVNLFPGDVEVGRRESGRLALALEHARDSAWFGGRPTAVTFDAGHMRQWRLAGDRWQDDASRESVLGDGGRVTAVYVEGQPLGPGERLVFLPDGLGMPFRVALDVRGLPWAIEGDAAGAVAVVEP
jgi:general secretion pathway protein H